MRSQECMDSFTSRGVMHIHLNSAWHLKDNLIFKFVISFFLFYFILFLNLTSVAIMVNKKSKMQYLDAISKKTE